MLRLRVAPLASILVPFAVACGSVQSAPDPSTVDGGAASLDGASPADAGTLDAATADSGRADASAIDASVVDAGVAAACGSRGSPPCPRGTFCFRPDSCGEADEGGTCIAPPGACPRILAPVCGCDGRTYDNACEAQRQQVSVRASGACARVDAAAPPRDAGGGIGAPCGGFAGLACAAGLFCLEPRGQCATVADGMGECTARPSVCPGVFTPVCGCDRVTYSNECAAHAAGRSVASAGACP
jgi:hypothetical protein